MYNRKWKVFQGASKDIPQLTVANSRILREDRGQGRREVKKEFCTTENTGVRRIKNNNT